MLVHSYDGYKYVEVFKVLQRCCGAIRKTETTGKYISCDDMPHLNPNFITAPVSTSLLHQETFEIDVVTPSFFGPKFED